MQVFTASTAEINSGFLNETESKHCIKVLRKSIGDEINITNGEGELLKCVITVAHQKKCEFNVIKNTKTSAITPPLHIAIAPTKNIDRFEFFLEKCTEIGIQKITPILCFHSERKVLKTERLEKIIVSACKQSKNYHFPILNELTPLKDILSLDVPQKLIAHCNEEEKVLLKSLAFQKETLLLIGPEGDFSKDEIKLALKNGFQPISLGESRLRTETAGLVACTTVNLGYEA